MKLELIGHTDLGGHGDTMQLIRKDQYLYVGHMHSMGTSVVDIADPANPQVVHQIPNPPGTHTHKVQIAEDLLLVNQEQYGQGTAERLGLKIYDLEDPARPREIGFFRTGGRGVHRMWYAGGPYVYFSAAPDGFSDYIFVILDISDPTQPVEVSRWWIEGMWAAGGVVPSWPEDLRYMAHHAVVAADRAYLGFWDAGLVILDISDRSDPRLVARLSWAPEDGGHTHTALPLPDRDLLVVTDEVITDGCKEPQKHVRIIDIKDENRPQVVSKFPVPEGDFCERGGRFGPHNVHENRPGSYISEERIYLTYFNAGLRVVDIGDPQMPEEVAHYIPPAPQGQPACQTNDVFVGADGLIFISDRIHGGVHILERRG